jgi:excisionase family DNA binding protein
MEKRDADILNVEEAADLLRIPRSSVYKLAQEGKIPAQKVGKHWRFYRVALLSWIAGDINFEEKKSNLKELDF